MSDRSVRVILSAIVAPYMAAMGQAIGSSKALEMQLHRTSTAGKVSQGVLAGVGKGSMLAMGGATLGAYALVKGISEVTGAAIDFESSFAGIRKTVDATEAEFLELETDFRRLATEIPVSVNELNRIGELGGQLGIAKEDLIDFTKVIAELGVTTDLTTEDAAMKLAQFAAATQMPHDKFSNLASSVVHLGNNFETTEATIVEYAQRLSGAGRIAGFTEADTVGLGAAMASIGVQAEAGGTATQKALLTINKAVVTGSEELETFASTAGMTADEFARQWRKNPAEAFIAFVEGLGAAGDDAQLILEKLGLTDQRLTRAFLGVAGAGDKMRKAIEFSNDAFAENNALQEEAAKRFETTEMKVQLAKNQIEDLKIAWGDWTAQTLGEGAQALTDVMQVQNRYNDQLGATVDLLTQLGDQYTRGTTSADDFINVVMRQVEGLEDFGSGMPETISELRENLEAMVSDVESDTLFERLGNFGRAETGELRFKQAEAVLELVKSMESGVPILEDGTNALGETGEAAETMGGQTKKAGKDVSQAVSGFDALFETAKDFRDWRDSASDALGDLSGEFAELSDDAHLTADELISAFREQIEATENFRKNLDTLITRGAKPALIKDLVDMGEEGARWAAALAGASQETFNAFVNARRGADREMAGLTAAVRRSANSVVSDAGRMKASIDSLTRAIQGVPREVSVVIQTQFETTGSGKLAPGQAEELEGRARGGPVLPNRSYLVGEEAPEILQMDGSGGRVIPLDARPASGGPVFGSGDRIEININGGNLAEVERVVLQTIGGVERSRGRITRARQR